jgi:hypothetical protein
MHELSRVLSGSVGRDAGIESLSLSVAAGNRARELYESGGYRVVGRERDSETMLKAP